MGSMRRCVRPIRWRVPQQHTDFRLHRSGTHWGFFDKWAIDEASLPSVKVNIQGVEAATINNRKVAVDNGAASFPVCFIRVCMRCRMIRWFIRRRR